MKNNKLIAGIDDATKCPCIGSIFIAGVVATPAVIKKWKSLGITDSKMVTKAKREELAPVIKATAQAYVIDEIRPGMMADATFNLNEWEMLTVLSIINRLPVKIIEVFIDNWEVSRAQFFERMSSLLNSPEIKGKGFVFDTVRLQALNYIPEHRADENYVVVGAASILAKVASDAQYDEYRREYGDFGSGSPADPKTRLYVWQNRNTPPPIIRISWETYKHLSKLERIEDDLLYSKVRRKVLHPEQK